MPQLRLSRPRPFAAVAAAAVLVALTIAAPAHARSPAKDFPGFATQKDSLGPVALVTDAIFVEDVLGSIDKVYLADCKQIGAQVLETFASKMAAKGYKIQTRALMSAGVLAKTKSPYRVYEKWDQHKMDEMNFPLHSPPFFIDTTFVRDDSAMTAWRSVASGVWGFEKQKDKPADPLTGIGAFRDALGAPYAFVVLVAGTKIPFGKQLLQGGLSSMTHVSGSIGSNITVNGGLDFTQYSGTGIYVAMIDCRSGEVLWADNDYEKKSIDVDRVNGLSKNILKRLP